jgi:hypothetical protein
MMSYFSYGLPVHAQSEGALLVRGASLSLEIPATLSPEQHNRALSAGKGLVGNTESMLERNLPKDIFESFQVQPIRIELDSNIPYDGYFHPSEPRTISLHPRLLSNAGLEEITIHEIFHALHFQVRPNEENWLKEGLAQAFSLMGRRNFGGFGVEQALKGPSMPLMGPYDHSHAPASWYGKNLLFVRYLLRRCSPTANDPLKLLWALAGFTQSPQQLEEFQTLKGVAWVDWVLSNWSAQNKAIPGECKSFSSIFRAFSLAFATNRSSGLVGEPYLLFPTTLQTHAERAAFTWLEPFQFRVLLPGPALNDAVRQFLAQDGSIEAYELSELFPYAPRRLSVKDLGSTASFSRVLVLRLQ